jgi:magnesium chelatase subunit D
MSAPGDAALVAALFAVDPVGSGGVCLRSQVLPARSQWLQILRDLLPVSAPLRRMPFNIADGRLMGGLDLAATLRANKPIAERGALAAADGGVIVVSMAERLSGHTAACLNAVMDAGEVALPREGVFIRSAARIGVVALDEGMSEGECIPACLLDRLAFLLDFSEFSARTLLLPEYGREQIAAARGMLPRVRVESQVLHALCATSMALGAGSLRVTLLAARVAAAAAALDGRIEVAEEDAIVAGRLVLVPRATILPAAEPKNPPPERPDTPSDAHSDAGSDGRSAESSTERDGREMDDIVLAAAQAAIPGGLLARLQTQAGMRSPRSGTVGRAGAPRNAGARGRPCGVRCGPPRGDARLNVIETLRAAAPWQSLRGRDRQRNPRVLIACEDFRVTRYRQRAQSLTIFAVDASGSSALHRLAEAKGAVELLLAECYIRRDQVAVIGFRGRAAELLLPPTRSLVRAKRSLAELAGGGGTPLAAAIGAAMAIAHHAQRRGATPTIVMLTDGRANVARDGTGGRNAAHADALRAAVAVRTLKIAALFVDTSPRPGNAARELAQMMDAQYIPLPFADARALSDIITTTRDLSRGTQAVMSVRLPSSLLRGQDHVETQRRPD